MKIARKDYRRRANAISKCRLGVGVDIELIDRFRMLNKVEHRSFLKMIFTKKEHAYCFSKQYPAPHLAVRFCAKEATVKALAGVGIHKISYRDIEITNDQKGVPAVKVRLKDQKVKVFVSLSHADHYAIAFAIVCRI